MRRNISIFLMMLMLIALTPTHEAKADSVSAISVTVGSAVAISNSSDTQNGTLPVTLSVTPAIGASAASSVNQIRIRANTTTWMLGAYQSATFAAGGTGLAATDIMLAYATGTHGAAGNSSAGTVSFSGTTLNDVSTNMASLTAIVTGSAKTAASATGSANSTNYFAINNTVSVEQDFFFSPGTATAEITYVLSAS